MSGAISKLRVVIADDERPARSFLASVLRKFDDVEIVGEAANGMEAVALIESLQPDLALLDLQMPELDGMGVVQLLRKNPHLAQQFSLALFQRLEFRSLTVVHA